MAKRNESSTGTRLLPVQLDLEEQAQRGTDLAKELVHLGELEQEKRDQMKTLGDLVKASRAKLDELGRAVSDGVEEREIECKWTKNYRDGMLVCVRLDTNEEVERRAMTDAERQMSIDDIIAQIGAPPAGIESEGLPVLHQEACATNADPPGDCDCGAAAAPPDDEEGVEDAGDASEDE